MRKKIIAVLTLAALLAFRPAFRASAMGRDTFILDDAGGVALSSPHGSEEGIASLTFSLKVDSANAEEVSFRFAGLSAEVQEYRYHADSHNLNIYIAGSEALFKSGQEPLDMGRVVVLDDRGKETEARISVVEGSLAYVYGTETKQADKVIVPDSVMINASENPDILETPPADSGSSGAGGDSSDSAGGGKGSGNGTGGNGAGSGGDWQEIDNGGFISDGPDIAQGTGTGADTGGQTGITTRPGTGTGVIGTGNQGESDGRIISENYNKLLQLSQRAQTLKESEYTEESFAALREAIDKAKHALENTSSTDQDLEDALLELENAIGALTRKDEMTVVEPEKEVETAETTREVTEVGVEDAKDNGSLLPIVLTVIFVIAAAAGGVFFVLSRQGLLPWGKKARKDGKWRDITGRK